MSNIRGLGNDLIEVERVRESIERHGDHFLNRLFTEKEKAYCAKYKDPVPHYAGRFAAKEAIVKALGTGFGAHVSWHDLEVLSDPLGKPVVQVSEALRRRFGECEILVSISHTAEYATAVAVWVRD